MAFEFNDCLIPFEAGANTIFAECCINITCRITNTGDNNNINDFEGGSYGGSFSITDVNFNGAPPTFPFFVPKGGQFELSFSICPLLAGQLTDTIYLKFYDTLGSQTFDFNIESILFESSIDISSINFSNVAVGSSASQQINLINPTIGCRFYDFTTYCQETVLSESSMALCQNEQGAFVVTWSPSAAGNINCDVVIETTCFSYAIPVNGNAIEPSTQGTRIEQKNKVDQTTRVETCSPRTANNRCQTARTMQSAIRSNARRFGKR